MIGGDGGGSCSARKSEPWTPWTHMDLVWKLGEPVGNSSPEVGAITLVYRQRLVSR